MEQVSPSAMPAASSQGRMVACGARAPGVVPAILRASRARDHSRSRTRQYRDKVAKKPMNTSSNPMRDSVRATPSIARSSPARPASSGERVRRIVRRASSITVRIPATAGMNRQPKGDSGPKISMPAPMSHLPSCGWTT